MAKVINNSISIEKFAAYLDGNLSSEETLEIGKLILNDPSLSEIMNINNIVDDQVKQMEEGGFKLPAELDSPDFVFPQLVDTTEFPNLPYPDIFPDYFSEVGEINELPGPCVDTPFPHHTDLDLGDLSGVDGHTASDTSSNNASDTNSNNEIGAHSDIGF